MLWRCALLGLVGSFCVATCGAGDAPDIPALPTADVIATAPTFGPNEPVLATHYFYWYRWPDEHFFHGARHTASILRHHFPDAHAVSYESVAWHRRQMEDLLAAGIDVALCVYWGAPNQYDKPDLRFSVRGLPPLVAALDELAKRGPTPRVALFYDTSTLLGEHAFREPGRGNVDLRTAEGKDIFYRTIRDFFCLVPPRHWACIDGRPVVQLYESAFAAGHDQSTLDYVYEHFAKDFAGRRPLIVTGPSWSLKGDLRTGWGAALGGPLLSDGAAQIGPGYDDSPVPGRTTPTRDRLGGGFYAASWALALQSRPRLIIIETWSELHEGTAICETLEDGRYYIDLTRHYSTLFKAGQGPSGDDWAQVVRTLLSAQASKSRGREFASRLAVEWRVEAPLKKGTGSAPESPGDDQKISQRGAGPLFQRDTLVEEGLRLCADVGDGAVETTEMGAAPCVRTRAGVSANRYVYFDLADPYYYDHRGTLTVRVTYFDAGRAPILVQYDSTDQSGTLAGRYKQVEPPLARTDTNTWKTATVTLAGARCANRQNGGADFRFESVGADLALRRVEVTKLPEGYAP